jgi:hypothetical protein
MAIRESTTCAQTEDSIRLRKCPALAQEFWWTGVAGIARPANDILPDKPRGTSDFDTIEDHEEFECLSCDDERIRCCRCCYGWSGRGFEVEVSVGGDAAETRSRLSSRLDCYLFASQGRNAEPECTPLSSAISWKRRYLQP